METPIEHKFLDPNIPRKGRVLKEHLEETTEEPAAPPFFSLIEFNLSGLCNRKCVFCPRVDPKVFPNINRHIPIKLYERIMVQLAQANYDGMILYSGFGEPLLYKRIELLIEISKRHCPQARIEMVTNGDLVTADRLRSLFDSGLQTLLISMYDGPEQVDIFKEMMADAGVDDSQVVLRTRWLSAEEHYGITLVNRSGMVDIPEAGIWKLTEPLKRRCFYPFYQVVVDYDGSVLLCTHDWGKKLVVGNLKHQSVEELWNSATMRRVRLSLSQANRNFPPCNVCDVDGTLMGTEHFDRWIDYYDQSAVAT